MCVRRERVKESEREGEYIHIYAVTSDIKHITNAFSIHQQT